MSSISRKQHWNHLVCKSCMVEKKLQPSKRTRSQEGPCCFCGGNRPTTLRGVSTTRVKCSAMEGGEKETQKELDAWAPVTAASPVEEQAPPKPKQEKQPSPGKPVLRGRLMPVSEEKQKELDEKRAYASRLVKFTERAVQSMAERGRNEEFSFVVVRIKPEMQYGEAGAHIHQGEGNWTGRKGQRSHYPKHAVLITDLKSHKLVSMGIRWRCGGIASFGKLTKEARLPMCKGCIKSMEWSQFMESRRKWE